MREDVVKLLNLTRLPARLDTEQTAAILGFQSHDLPVLMKAKLLRPLGNPTLQAVKFFDAVQVTKCAGDPAWLHKATRTIYQYWNNQNGKRAKRRSLPKEEDHLLAA